MSNPTLNEASVLEHEERLRQAMIASDRAALAELLDDELVFTTFLGEAISKDHDLQAHESGAFSIHDIQLSEQLVRFVGGVAIVTCRALIDSTFDDDRTQKAFRFSRVWAKSSDQLRVVAGQATLIWGELNLD